MLRVHAIEQFGSVKCDQGVLARYMQSVYPAVGHTADSPSGPLETDGYYGIVAASCAESAGRLLSCDITMSPGCFWTARFEPAAVTQCVFAAFPANTPLFNLPQLL